MASRMTAPEERNAKAGQAQVALIDGRSADQRADEPATQQRADDTDDDVEQDPCWPSVRITRLASQPITPPITSQIRIFMTSLPIASVGRAALIRTAFGGSISKERPDLQFVLHPLQIVQAACRACVKLAPRWNCTSRARMHCHRSRRTSNNAQNGPQAPRRGLGSVWHDRCSMPSETHRG